MTLLDILNHFRRPKELIELTPEDLERKMKENPRCILIDVRTSLEYQSGHINGAKSYPLINPSRFTRDYKPDQAIILVCRSGHRSLAAARVFIKHNYKQLFHLKGGMKAWLKAGKLIKK
ncbi:rhodanese-like domain-containing protein [Desulfosporosinus sp. BG]|uniref:rhodanese-like domain-containing protein n=1 Tax=Desulfosporosinus sp. BG TaxID=1633135 RepID=UPI00083A13E9|nr:rhodanese-like domain-containing protein [Desulfosporosinus sp. BG]ODA41880.1 rhodanese-related sulfurtransferase [Desulfosporosinus sp. BG]